MIAKLIVTLAFADAQTLSAQEVGGQNAEAVIDTPEGSQCDICKSRGQDYCIKENACATRRSRECKTGSNHVTGDRAWGRWQKRYGVRTDCPGKEDSGAEEEREEENAEAVIDAPEEGDRRQLGLERQGAIRRKTTTTQPPKLNRGNAIKRKLGEEDAGDEGEGEEGEEDYGAEEKREEGEEDYGAEEKREEEEEYRAQEAQEE